MPRGRGGITKRVGVSHAPPRTAAASPTDTTLNGAMPRGRGGITKRVGVSHALQGTMNEILDDSTSNGDMTRGNGENTRKGGLPYAPEGTTDEIETTLKRPPNPFELFVYTHTKNHDETTFIDKKAKTIYDNVLRLREAREANHAEGESSQLVNESELYYEAVGGVKKRNVYGLGSQAFAYYPNPATRTSATYMPHEPKYLEMERKMTRKIGKQQQILEHFCSHLNIPVPSTESDTEDNNEEDTVGGTQNQNTSNSEEHEV
ncbi:hypothetical protein CTI12_AA145680 [Artemisia annua]|uniref:Uncharacterized protein n=1 Tax=Artemisia annua TaxID=35608 RepID=A0A2U1PJF8_ARTAN|nr:hypothetical protein CTI12_AA145680 [Artemisia annua]